MDFILAFIGQQRIRATAPTAQLQQDYLNRCARYSPTTQRAFATEEKLLIFIEDLAARTRPFLLLTDSTGDQISSPELAAVVTGLFDRGIQTLVLAIGPADGWSSAARQRADKTIAFGRITLPHELAAVVVAEQLYRALTIRAGHPYHSGH